MYNAKLPVYFKENIYLATIGLNIKYNCLMVYNIFVLPAKNLCFGIYTT